MANYINSSIPIYGYQKAIKGLSDDLYGDIEVDSRILQQLEDLDYDKERVIRALAIFLAMNTGYTGVGYFMILDAIVTTYIRNYSKYFKREGVYYGLNEKQIQQSWEFEKSSIIDLLAEDSGINQQYHADNIALIKESAFYRIARRIANIYIAKKTVDVIQSGLASRSNRYQSVLGAVGQISPNEVHRIGEMIRRDQVLRLSEVIRDGKSIRQVISDSDRWFWHQWVAYTFTDYPCYGTNGEIVKVGEAFSNGYYSPSVHRGCYCITTPFFKN